MYELAKNEFSKWVNQIKFSNIDKYDITMINIIISNFDSLAPLGTAVGRRAKKLCQLISEKKLTCDDEINILIGSQQSVNSVAKCLKSLKVKSFRGFYSETTFNLDNQYLLFYGPNGSGKSSFCEALEYSLLGTIEEASSKNIDIQRYIKNIYTKKAMQPLLVCDDSNNEEFNVLPDINKYRFCFIEKNRIDRFSHISAISSKNQTELLSALFGFSEFNSFVDDFTSGLDNYLQLKSEKKEDYEKFILVNQHLDEELRDEQINSAKYNEQLSNEIKKLQTPEISNYQDAMLFINGTNNNGKLQQYRSQINKLGETILKHDWYKLFVSNITTLKQRLNDLDNINEHISQDVSDLARLEFYKSLEKLRQLYSDNICPACKTPLDRVSINPFENAEKQIDTLTEIQQNVKLKKEVIQNIQSLIIINNDLVKSVKNFEAVFSCDCNNYILEVDNERLENSNIEFASLLNKVNIINSKFLDEEGILAEILKYNEVIKYKIKTLEEKSKSLLDISTGISQSKTLLDNTLSTISSKKEAISTYEENKKKFESELIAEQKVIDYNTKMNISYIKVVKLLQDYKKELPLIMAEKIGEKVTCFYNIINEYDASFELVKSISMPKNQKESIEIEFKDKTKCNALQILSEGHIKILGLSILLAKATIDEVPFIIFDDIVNAIDDDHRSGVANLLTTIPEFTNRQIVVTCHGDIFIKNMQTNLRLQTRERNSTVYYFMAASNLNDRGIVINFNEPKEPLMLAEKDLQKGALKDAAAKCRQATECISYYLWKKLNKGNQNCVLSVQIRTPTSKPDLKSIVTSLSKHLKGIANSESLRNDFNKLIDDFNWNILNIGTHEQDDQNEFESSDVRNIIELLKSIYDQSEKLKIQVSIKECL